MASASTLETMELTNVIGTSTALDLCLCNLMRDAASASGVSCQRPQLNAKCHSQPHLFYADLLAGLQEALHVEATLGHRQLGLQHRATHGALLRDSVSMVSLTR